MLTFLAALRYLSDSERSDVERCDISEREKGVRMTKPLTQGRQAKALLSSESPRQRSSSIFFVIIRVTSCSSSFSLSKFELPAALAALVSRYNRAVFDMNVSLVELVNACLGVAKLLVRTKPDKGVWLPYRLHFGAVGRGELFR